jgi:hypothetical protein
LELVVLKKNLKLIEDRSAPYDQDGLTKVVDISVNALQLVLKPSSPVAVQFKFDTRSSSEPEAFKIFQWIPTTAARPCKSIMKVFRCGRCRQYLPVDFADEVCVKLGHTESVQMSHTRERTYPCCGASHYSTYGGSGPSDLFLLGCTTDIKHIVPQFNPVVDASDDSSSSSNSNSNSSTIGLICAISNVGSLD